MFCNSFVSILGRFFDTTIVGFMYILTISLLVPEERLARLDMCGFA